MEKGTSLFPPEGQKKANRDRGRFLLKIGHCASKSERGFKKKGVGGGILFEEVEVVLGTSPDIFYIPKVPF